jgi:hypothetical protein
MLVWTRRQFGIALTAFADTGFELLSMDIGSGAIQGPRANVAALPGSLVKPFLAVAHGKPFPTVECKGCRPGAVHGRIELVEAIAQSCNFYFQTLSLRVTHERACLAAASYGLPAPPDDVDARVGLGREWRIPPARILLAYARLASNRSDAVVTLILEGMRQSATRGTARAIGAPRDRVLAKTGTAPCDHKPRMPGDGLAIALWPADSPRRILLAREHGVPGASAAARLRGLLT